MDIETPTPVKESEFDFTNKLKLFFSDKLNIALIAVMLLAFAIRLYYFTLTAYQPVWWDEAEYMLKAKSLVFGTPATGWAWFRPILFPLLAASFFKVGLGVTDIKVTWLFISIATVFLVYLVGKELFNKKTGLISAAIFSVFYLDIFYMGRLLVDNTVLFFSLIGIYCFMKRNSNKWLGYASLPVIMIGTLFKFNTVVVFGVFLLYLLMVDGIKFYKEKVLWVSGILGLLTYLPYAVWSWIKFGGPFAALFRASIGANRDTSAISVLGQYISYFPNYIYVVFLVLFLFGLGIILINLFIARDLIKKEKNLQSMIFCLMLIFIPLLSLGIFINHFEDRYINIIFPAVFFVTALSITTIQNFVAKYNKWLAVGVTALILIAGSYPLLQYTDNIVKAKVDSYKGLEDAGLWIKANSNSDDIVFSAAIPEITYYSERATYAFETEEEFEGNVSLLKPKFLVLSLWERSPDWSYNWPQTHNATIIPVATYFMGAQMDTVVFQFTDYEKLA